MTSNTTSKVADITSVLRDEILRGQYRPGERLPSERDLAARFETNRGAIREVLKKLEQMGIAAINPGGVRVVPVEEASLDVLGHIMDLRDVPDHALVGQVLEVYGALLGRSARTAVETASDEQLANMRQYINSIIENSSDPEENQQAWRKLSLLCSHVNKNLVIRLILNGLKTQFVGRITNLGLPVTIDNDRSNVLLRIIDRGLQDRDAAAVSDAITQHFSLVQEATTRALKSAGIEPESATINPDTQKNS